MYSILDQTLPMLVRGSNLFHKNLQSWIVEQRDLIQRTIYQSWFGTLWCLPVESKSHGKSVMIAYVSLQAKLLTSTLVVTSGEWNIFLLFFFHVNVTLFPRFLCPLCSADRAGTDPSPVPGDPPQVEQRHTWDVNTEQALLSLDVTTKVMVKWGLCTAWLCCFNLHNFTSVYINHKYLLSFIILDLLAHYSGVHE